MSRKDHQARKKKKRQERLRKEKHIRRALGVSSVDRLEPMDEPSNPVGSDFDEYDDLDEDSDALAPRPPYSPYTMERMHRKIALAMSSQSFKSTGEANAFVQSKFNRMVDNDSSQSDDPKEQAQELAYQALESKDSFRSQHLAQDALKLDPNCIDAQVLLAHLKSGESPDRLLSELQNILDSGRKNLGGDKFFRENEGHFWGDVFTRPYMRALNEKAHLLFEMEQHENACACFEEMLKLNTNDNQGIRYILIGSALLANKYEVAREVLSTYAEEDSAMLNWARVLERFLSDDEPQAERILKKALRQNRHVTPILFKHKDLPPSKGVYEPGQESEAREIIDNLGIAWIKHLAALKWLANQCGVKVLPKQ